MMIFPVSGSVIGWRPSSLRSMIASRRCARTTPVPPSPEPDTQKPLESGPRCRCAALMRWTASMTALSTAPMAPAIPHISDFLVVDLEVLKRLRRRCTARIGRHINAPIQRLRRHVAQILIVAHDVEVDIRTDVDLDIMNHDKDLCNATPEAVD